jgi:hypothetical protein
MRLVAQPIRANLAIVDAVTASMRGWLIALLAWFCEVVDALPRAAWRCPLLRDAYAASKRAIAADLRRATRKVRKILFLRANDAFRATCARQGIHRVPRGVRPGVRAGKRGRGQVWRRATAGIVAGMHHGSLRARIKRLRAMLDNTAPFVARVLKRLPALWRSPHGQGLVLTASREPHASLAAPALIAADSS